MKLPGWKWHLRLVDRPDSSRYDFTRIPSLSDNVFAFAMTLLVIQIALPETSSAGISAALLRLWPRYFAYALSFLVISSFWISHHAAFRLISRYDTTLVWLNLILLMFVAFLPFPTAVLGQHSGTPAAAVLYAVAVGLTSAASASCWWYASARHGLLAPTVDRLQVRAVRARTISTPVFFALTVPVAAFAPSAAEALWVAWFPLAQVARVWPLTTRSKPPEEGKNDPEHKG
jgi:uncharacterized membrane protein